MYHSSFHSDRLFQRAVPGWLCVDEISPQPDNLMADVHSHVVEVFDGYAVEPVS